MITLRMNATEVVKNFSQDGNTNTMIFCAEYLETDNDNPFCKLT